MAFEIVDGATGEPHISSEDLACLNEALIGEEDCVFTWGSNLGCTMSSANKATIGTGAGMVGGKRWWNKAPADVTVQGGTQGQNRNDIIVARYANNNGVESITPAIVMGTPTSGIATDPEVGTDDMALWRLPIKGIATPVPERIFEPLPTFAKVRDSVSHAGTIYAGFLPKKPVDAAGHILVWTDAEFRDAFGAEPKDAFISVANPASGISGIFLSSPRWNGSGVYTTQMKVDGSYIKPVGGDGSTPSTAINYLVAVY